MPDRRHTLSVLFREDSTLTPIGTMPPEPEPPPRRPGQVEEDDELDS
jgi:hypothetical protein